MGKSESKLCGVSHEEAAKKGTEMFSFRPLFLNVSLTGIISAKSHRWCCLSWRAVTEDELSRLRNAFKRASHNGYMNKSLFSREVLTDAVPPQLAVVS